MHVIVCYDVPKSSRRTRIFQGLKGYIQPVQKSVFEGRLTPRSYARMIAWLEGTIVPSEDNVRVYRLCAGCRGHIEHLGRAFEVATEPEDIVV